MRLEMGNIYIKDIQFADTSKIEDGILYVDKGAVKAVALEDEHIKTVTFDIAKPGESVRITPVKDVIEPRVKVEGKGGVFPGIISKVDTVGSGKTYALKGMAVVTAGRIVGFQEGIIDMTGPGADYTPFSKTLNLVMVCEPVEGIKQHEYEKAVRFAGFRVAAYIGELARELTPDEIKVYETCGIKEGITQYPDLPRVAYVQMLQSQGLLHDTYVYGVDAKKTLPTILSPTEIMDGAIVSGNCVSACDKNPTYVHENNPVVHDLFEEHGKTLNFVCQIITNENVYLADKERSSDWTAKLCKMLDLDGVIVSQEGFGNPDTDLIMNCKKIEAEGIKTVIITDEYAGRDGKSQSLADADVAADAVVTGGNANEVVILPKLDKVIGTFYFNENLEKAKADILAMVKEQAPDVFIAGPAFNAGRYGVACGTIAAAVQEELGIPAVTGMYVENPGADMFKNDVYMISTKNSAAGMRDAVKKLAPLAVKLAKGEKIGSSAEEGYIPNGVRVNFFEKERGSKRAVKMLIKKLNDKPYVTEYPMPNFDRVEPNPAVKDLAHAKIALVTSGGIVPKGNPDHIESSSASHYGEYDITGVTDLTEETYETAHGGYDPVYANEDPDRVLPVDVLRDMEKEGVIGSLHHLFYTTVGNGTSVASAKAFAAEYSQKLKADGVDAVILTST